MGLGFMQPIGGKVESYEYDYEASKKLSDLKAVISMMEEVSKTDEEYSKGVRDAIEVIRKIIEK